MNTNGYEVKVRDLELSEINIPTLSSSEKDDDNVTIYQSRFEPRSF
jgi:hypothetical protein